MRGCCGALSPRDRKSTRLNSSHTIISYAVFCLKKKKTDGHPPPPPAPCRAVRWRGRYRGPRAGAVAGAENGADAPPTGRCISISFFFFNDTAATEIYTLSLPAALPI